MSTSFLFGRHNKVKEMQYTRYKKGKITEIKHFVRFPMLVIRLLWTYDGMKPLFRVHNHDSLIHFCHSFTAASILSVMRLMVLSEISMSCVTVSLFR